MIKTNKLTRAALLERAASNNRARLAATVPLLIMAFYMYGPRPLLITAIALVVAVLCDLLAALLRRRAYDYKDVSSLLFAVLIVCMMPATIPYTIVCFTVLTAILVGKHLFGGFGNYPFHPAALGYVIAVVSWPTQMLSFPAPFTPLSLNNVVSFTSVEAPAYTLKLAGLPNLSSINIFLGNFAGPLGMTASLVVLACGLVMLAVFKFDLMAPLGFFGICTLLLWCFPRVPGADTSQLLVMELLSCGLAFAAVFLLQDETTAPRGLLARFLYGALVGLIAILFEFYGSYPYGICFAVLSANALSGYLERFNDFLIRLLSHPKAHERKEQTV